MFSLSTAAFKKIIHEAQAQQTLRLVLSPRGCGEPKVSFHPDTPSPHDISFSFKSITILMDKTLYARLETVNIDLKYGDFSIRSKNVYEVAGCGQCPAAATNGGDCSRSPAEWLF